MQNRGAQLQIVQMTPVVKALMIINVAIWLFGQVILEQYFLEGNPLIRYFGLIPVRVVEDFFLWQPLTYMFLHSMSLTHIIFNMLMLWWFGAELEMRWGPRFFLTYYLVSGVGAGLIYTVGITLYSVVSGSVSGLVSPVVGASGAIFGLLVAFGILFGERVILFFFVFPMRVKYFVLIIGAVEVVSLLNVGSRDVANLAHIGGLFSGYVFLVVWTKSLQRKRRKPGSESKRGLRLVVNNEEQKKGEGNGPKYWN